MGSSRTDEVDRTATTLRVASQLTKRAVRPRHTAVHVVDAGGDRAAPLDAVAARDRRTRRPRSHARGIARDLARAAGDRRATRLAAERGVLRPAQFYAVGILAPEVGAERRVPVQTV